MKNFIYAIFVIFSSLCLRKAYGGYFRHIPFEQTIEVKLDDELAKNFHANDWEYTWTRPPLTEGNCLTYFFIPAFAR